MNQAESRLSGGTATDPESSRSSELQQCIQDCMDCYQACIQTMHHCLAKGGEHAKAEHIRELANCAQICLTSVNLMLSGSPMHVDTCGICAKACEQCARSCAEIGEGDATMEACVAACQRCAESCRQMSN